MLILAAIFTLLGSATLALSQKRHWQTVTASPEVKATQKAAVGMGWMLLLAAWLVCLGHQGLGFASLLWPLLISMASIMTALALSFYPSLLKPLSHALRRLT